MWAINNQSPFDAERAWVRDRKGAEVWLVAVKGTFIINPDGTVTLSEEQEKVNFAPVYRGAPETTSLLYDSDLHHKKENTDVLIEGHAWAPDSQPLHKMDVALRVGSIQKVLRVFGDRLWRKSNLGMSIGRPVPFIKMPIIYERAFGGTDQVSNNPKHHGWESRNPVGSGFSTKSEHLIGKRLPNIENPTNLIRHWKDRPTPVGFGPIAGHWSPRVELAGTYDEKWEQERLPLLPDDFNDKFYQCAPLDQQVTGFLKGGEYVELLNLTPSGRLMFHLPRITIGFTTHFEGRKNEEHRGILHTVLVKPDEKKLILVWHTNLECHHRVLKLTSTTIRIKQRPLQSGKSGHFTVS
jgi:hypothetical protein